MRGGCGAGVGAVVGSAGGVEEVPGGGADPGEADRDGDAGEPGRVFLDGAGVAGEGGVAEFRVEGCAAARADEVCVVGGGGGGSGCGSWAEEDEEEEEW